MDEVESLFTQHFANGDRKKAMKFLRPQQHRESHMITFFVGKTTQNSSTVLIRYYIIIHVCMGSMPESSG